MAKPVHFRMSRSLSAEKLSTRRYDADRQQMVELLKERGIRDQRLLEVMSNVDRREFVQEPFGNRAYDDSALPIGSSQTISQPYTVAFMTECLEVSEGDRILEIGTGSGYQAAILAEMGARVFTIERHMKLLAEARNRFDRLKYQIASKCGDGTIGWKEYAPYNGIIVTAGAPEIPQPLLDQLAMGGLLVIPIGDLEVQTIHAVRKTVEGFESREIVGFKFVPLIGKKGWK
jgi:protein-L-isoaspartate(D-aspartate) O-methyltransferase